MPEQVLETQLAAIGTDGYVTSDEVLFLRRSVFADGLVQSAELDALFSLGDRAPEGDPEWLQFFAEATADFYLREEEPQGHLTKEEFATLKHRVSQNGHNASTLECALLVKLMEVATQTPPEMAQYTGQQLKHSILSKPDGAVVNKNDAMLIRRYIFAAGGDGNIAVTRDEAELLFDINDAVHTAQNNPAWTELFVQGIINHLMAHLGYTAPSREEAFRSNAWASDHSVNATGFFKRMLSGGLSAIGNAHRQGSLQAEQNTDPDVKAAQAAIVTASETEWLASRIGRDGAFDQNEQRLIDRMRELESKLPYTLKALLERAA